MAALLEDELVLNMNKKLHKIDESLNIGCVGSCNGTICSLEVFLPQKGNSKIIKQLESIGFKKNRKEKMSDGSFRLNMIYYVRHTNTATNRIRYNTIIKDSY